MLLVNKLVERNFGGKDGTTITTSKYRAVGATWRGT